jgi:hypothetical protein
MSAKKTTEQTKPKTTTEPKRTERRVCRRFKVPGATVSIALGKILPKEKEKNVEWDEEFCPLLDISCGGIKCSSKKFPAINSDIIVKILIPGERIPLTLMGEVRWLSTKEEIETCKVGVQFNPYGEGEGRNYPGLLVKLMELEHKFASSDSDITKYEIDA